MKITVNYTRQATIIMCTVSGIGLSACAPMPMPQIPGVMPQAYPMQRQAQVQRPQPAAQIPRAAALQTNRPAVAQARPSVAANVQQRPTQQRASQQRPAPVQQARVAPPRAQTPATRTVQAARPAPARPAPLVIPPVLSPAQRQIAAAQPATRYTRPSASVSRPPTIVYREEKQQKPAVTARRPSLVQRAAKPAITPAPQKTPRPSASVKARPAEAVKPVPQKEVLDMSNTAPAKPVASAQAAVKKAPTPPARSYSSSPAVTILVKQANNELSVGKTGRAAATLERALRISPDDPVLWLRLAEINEQQGNKAQAASMARKAINLAPADQNIKQRGQRLLN